MRLLNLKITNFKGIRSFELPVDGNNAIIHGTNGAGKTSLFDAYTWLLFGKDSNGRSETSFEVKPYGSSGLTVEVIGEFEHNGQTFTLSKTLAEKFAKINGEDESELQATFATKKAEYIQAQSTADKSELNEAKKKAVVIKDELADVEYKIRTAQAQGNYLKGQREKLLAEYRRINGTTFNESSAVCPTCGREYPEDRKQELLGNFNLRKSKELEENKTAGLQIKQQLQKCADDLAGFNSTRENLSAELERVNAVIAAAVEVKPAPFESTVAGEKLQAEITREQNVLFEISQNKGSQIAALKNQIAGIDAELNEINRRLASEAQVTQQDKRIEQLKAQAKELGKRRADLEYGIELANKFEQIKLTEIEDSVNSQFQYAEFKLFNRQINGGISECCEVTVGGIPYTTNLNTAAKANAGLDIINVISKKMKITAPIWLDGAESVVKYLPVEAQTIQLVVDGGSDQLRIYVED